MPCSRAYKQWSDLWVSNSVAAVSEEAYVISEDKVREERSEGDGREEGWDGRKKNDVMGTRDGRN